jgi:hypothetical protein
MLEDEQVRLVELREAGRAKVGEHPAARVLPRVAEQRGDRQMARGA